ncbi:SDR family oxidoreductase [Granulicella sp. dw_53]|uniref:SDR family NAD(P)-dependent oxidoreductase n=1 Tax=Granulicella sp. dw_53 TaxID=2719792 RepID=UPI001BD6C6DE|nr:SDR family oxidoreductase [Granulicella sp. dw_53]
MTTNHKGTALITGASTGIGAVYADRLARRGYDLILVARDQQRLTELATALTAKTGRSVDTLPADLTHPIDVERVAQRLRSDASISALVNNAGVGATAKLVDSNMEAMESMIQLNVTALTSLTLAVLPGFVQRANGLIINISSIAALAPEILNGVYSGSKSYVLSLTQSLHSELADKGLRFQAVIVGPTSTQFWAKAGQPVENLPQSWVMSPEEMVDAALVGLDQQELITMPSLPDASDWQNFETARLALRPNLGRNHPAERYLTTI